MEGPFQRLSIRLQPGPPELLWLVKASTEIVGPEDKELRDQSYMCHVNLDFHLEERWQRLPQRTSISTRAITLAQGMFQFQLPPGFGIPVMSDERLSMDTQVLNHNNPDADILLRHKVTLSYVRDADLNITLKPLFGTASSSLKQLDGPEGIFGLPPGTEDPPGPSCLPGEHPGQPGMKWILPDRYGRRFVGHWKVKPGEEVNHTVVTRQIGLPYDTTLHYAVSHLHPFAVSLELRDLTRDASLVKLGATNVAEGIGLERIETFSSSKGVRMFADHEYELVSVISNTSGVDQDAMATMMLFLLDRDDNQSKPRRHPLYFRPQPQNFVK